MHALMHSAPPKLGSLGKNQKSPYPALPERYNIFSPYLDLARMDLMVSLRLVRSTDLTL